MENYWKHRAGRVRSAQDTTVLCRPPKVVALKLSWVSENTLGKIGYGKLSRGSKEFETGAVLIKCTLVIANLVNKHNGERGK